MINIKKISVICVIFCILIATFNVTVYATQGSNQDLTNIELTTTKTVVNPGQNIKATISFGESLGAYTVDIAYDSNLLEYVSVEGGTANDNGTRVRVYYFDSTGGSNPRTSMKITFKAKTDITTSNPTEFTVTAEGLANADASVTYNNITVGLVKDFIVEPAYVDYTMDLAYTGDIVVNTSKDMTLTIASTMGRSYEKTRIIAEVTTPDGGSVSLYANNLDTGLTDIIQSGYGSVDGDAIGGVDVSKIIDIDAIFTKIGTYTINLKLINREDSDSVIVENTFNVNVIESAVTDNTDENIVGNTTNNSSDNSADNLVDNSSTNETTDVTNITTDTVEELPKTGSTIYGIVISVISILFIAVSILNRKKDQV